MFANGRDASTTSPASQSQTDLRSLPTTHLRLDHLASLTAPVFSDITSRFPTLEWAGIFGSVSRGTQRPDSDIDVLFVLPDDLERESGERDVHALAAPMAAWTGNDVRPLVYAADEVGPARVFSEILDDAMPIVGRLGWLRGRSMQQLERS